MDIYLAGKIVIKVSCTIFGILRCPLYNTTAFLYKKLYK
jgi:hypothetical protein